MPTAAHAVDEIRRFGLQASFAQWTRRESGNDRSGVAATRARFPLTCTRIAQRLTGVGSDVDEAQVAARRTDLLGALLARTRLTNGLARPDAVAWAFPPARTAGRGGAAVAASTQHYFPAAVSDESHASALGAFVAVLGGVGETRSTDSFTGSVMVGQMPLLAAFLAHAARVSLLPAPMTTAESVEGRSQRYLARTLRAQRCRDALRAGVDEHLGQSDRSRRRMRPRRSVRAKRVRSASDDPISSTILRNFMSLRRGSTARTASTIVARCSFSVSRI